MCQLPLWVAPAHPGTPVAMPLVCVHVRKFSRQVCFYKSHLLRRKWRTPLSGQVLCVRNGYKCPRSPRFLINTMTPMNIYCVMFIKIKPIDYKTIELTWYLAYLELSFCTGIRQHTVTVVTCKIQMFI